MLSNRLRLRYILKVVSMCLLYGNAFFLFSFDASIAQSSNESFDTIAAYGLLIDSETGSVLFEKNADTRIAPASLAKLMTAEVIFNALQEKKLQLSDEYLVSENSWRRGGAPSRTTTMFAAVKSKVSVNNLLQGLIILQANDAALTLAEGAFGSEENFVVKMNERAQQIGLKNSHFVNATGFPQDGQYTTLRDITMLAVYMQQHYPQMLNLYKQPSFEWNKIFQRNRNSLLNANMGVEGFLSGFTEGLGYSIVLSIQKDNKKLILALAGIAKEKDRIAEVKRFYTLLINDLVAYLVFDAHEVIGQAKVFGGVSDKVDIKTKDAITVLISKAKKHKLEVKISYWGPLTAPIMQNHEIGVVKVLSDGNIIMQKPVFTGQNIMKANAIEMAKNAFYELAFGWIRVYWN